MIGYRCRQLAVGIPGQQGHEIERHHIYLSDTRITERLWLGCQDSNLGMRGSKPRALPLGYTPILGTCIKPCVAIGPAAASGLAP